MASPSLSTPTGFNLRFGVGGRLGANEPSESVANRNRQYCAGPAPMLNLGSRTSCWTSVWSHASETGTALSVETGVPWKRAFADRLIVGEGDIWPIGCSVIISCSASSTTRRCSVIDVAILEAFACSAPEDALSSSTEPSCACKSFHCWINVISRLFRCSESRLAACSR